MSVSAPTAEIRKRESRVGPLESGRRLAWVDALRGLAILLMIPTNFAPYFATPHALWFRVLGSFAAPVFVMLSAGMAALNSERHDLKYYLYRGGLIVGFGAGMDLGVHRILPFTSFDVLYLIGLALPMAYLARRLSGGWLVGIGLSVFAASSLLRSLLGYHPDPPEISFGTVSWPGLDRILAAWFIDGWFPIFPWIGFAFLGLALFRALSAEDRVPHRLLLGGFAILAAGLVLLFLPVRGIDNLANEGILTSRGGYSEIFYPAVPVYLMTALGSVILLAWIVRPLSRVRGLETFGRYALLAYLLHQVIGEYVLRKVIPITGGKTLSDPRLSVSAVALTCIALYICFRLADAVKRTRPISSLPMVLLFGRSPGPHPLE